jgi:hypothetical protein
MNKEYEEWLSKESKAEVNDKFEKRKEKERDLPTCFMTTWAAM